QRITSPKAPDHGSTFLNIDDDTDSDKEFQSDSSACEAYSPYVLEKIEEICSPYAKGINNINQGTFALILPENSMVKVKVWFEDSVAKTIWIEGASPISYQPKGALPRRELYQNPTSINNNCIYFSCKPNGYSASNTPPQASESNEEHTLISLLYAIIAQLQRLLPQESCFTTPEFHEIKFESLYKSIKSAPAALQIIRAYLEHTTATSLLWIVDGLQFVVNVDTEPYLKELVNIIRAQEHAAKSKLCFMTEGKREVIFKIISPFTAEDALNEARRNLMEREFWHLCV
ncbi:hypothetical protein TMatcc_006087, partial [Talaromyces marneffei ATCC 18224]